MTDEKLVQIPAPAAPPRDNGELVFTEPWEGRAFGIALAMHEAHHFHLDDFRDQLIARISATPHPHHGYYENWLSALEALLVEDAIVTQSELDAARRALGASTE